MARIKLKCVELEQELMDAETRLRYFRSVVNELKEEIDYLRKENGILKANIESSKKGGDSNLSLMLLLEINNLICDNNKTNSH